MNYVDQLRTKHLKHFCDLKSVNAAAFTWSKYIEDLIGSDFAKKPNNFLDLGDKLRSIFTTTGSAGREQKSLAAGGLCWEFLVCWYLNLGFWGTNTIVLKNTRSAVPQALRDALTLTINNVKANTETDLLLVHFPQMSRLNAPTFDELNNKTSEFLDSVEVCIIQCKTNWNDNSQIPMLWNAVYEAGKSGVSNLHVGTNGVSLNELESFRYAFVTAPTNRTQYKSESVIVQRVSTLSGRNYWGLPTQSGVALSLKEFFSLYSSAFEGTGGPLRNLKSNFDSASPSFLNATQMRFDD